VNINKKLKNSKKHFLRKLSLDQIKSFYIERGGHMEWPKILTRRRQLLLSLVGGGGGYGSNHFIYMETLFGRWGGRGGSMRKGGIY
jgi:hypothetical protein